MRKCFHHLLSKKVFFQSRYLSIVPDLESAETSPTNNVKPETFVPKQTFNVPPELRLVLPDFMPEPDFKRRNPIADKLERIDMLRRRQVIEIPEFYVGSILAVTLSDQYAEKCSNRFIGICIARDDRGLRHHMTLRNVIDGQGVEVQYNLYNPMVQKIEVLKLEKRLDEQLYYLRDAEPQYSTVPFNMEPVTLPPGSPVPVNTVKVKLRSPPWSKRWERFDFKGVQDFWHFMNDVRRWKYALKTKPEPWRKFDIVAQYQKTVPRHDQELIYRELQLHEKQRASVSAGRKSQLLAPFQPKATKSADSKSTNKRN